MSRKLSAWAGSCFASLDRRCGQGGQHVIGDLGNGSAVEVPHLRLLGENVADRPDRGVQGEKTGGGDLVRRAARIGGGQQGDGAVRGGPQGGPVFVGEH
jgi:hypothetical protein